VGESSVVLGLTLNAALLLALTLVTGLVPRTMSRGAGTRAVVVTGVLVAAFGMSVMLAPVPLTDGVVFDVRSVVLSVSGLFFGLVPTAIAVAATSALRWIQGGVGAPFGIAVIVASGAVGVAWRRWRRGSLDRLGLVELYGFGLVVHVVMVAILSTMPAPLARTFWQQAVGPILLIYPVATVIVGRLLVGRIADERRQAERMALEVDLRQRAERNERRLAATLQRLKLLLEHAPASLAMFDRDLRFTAVSRRFVDDFGLDGIDLVGRHHYDVFPEIPPRFREAHQRALRGEVLRSEEDQLVRPSGEVMWQRWEVRPWFDEDGAIGGMILFTEDVTAQVKNRQQVQKLSRAVEQSPESIVITNVDGDIEFVNDAFVAATGYAKEEVLGQNPRILNSGRTPPETYREMWATLTEGRTWRGEFVNRRRDGSVYDEVATISPVRGSDGQVTHYVAVKEDVTEKKRIERELDQYRSHLETLVEERTRELDGARERAEVANHAKSAFLASMSHEIRTPLNAVVGLTHLLLRDDPTPEQRDRLAKVDSAAEHLLSIINDVLDVAKIEAGKMALDERDFHLSAVLDHVRSIIAASAEAKGLTVEIDRDHVPLWLRGDAARLWQALLNLAGNAVKFTEQGSIRLSSDLVEETADRLRVRFEVRDTGSGIPAEQIPTLFDDFEQGDDAITRTHGGTGLGLAITRRLAEMMGGQAGVESTPGVGTRVWFTCVLQRGRGVMPSRFASGEGTSESATSAPDFRGTRLLLAEDQPINREVATELLHGFGFDVDTADSGRAAIQRAREARYDLILMDVQMPDGNGLDATRAIRDLPGYEAVPILAMTANAFEEDRRACFAAGMNDFVPKPVDPQVLRTTLARWLDASAPAARPVAPSEVIEDVPDWAWEGLDHVAGLEATYGDEARYLDLLRRFAIAHSDDASRLRRELSAGDRDAARQRAHALKGVAGTLGARRLQEAAGAVERSLADGRTVEVGDLDEVAEQLGELERRIRSAPTEAPDDAATPSLPIAEVVARLTHFLEVDSPDAVTWVRSHHDALRREHGAAADPLVAAIERYDFERARALLARLG
jgi:PAS domain S-box-containing protein